MKIKVLIADDKKDARESLASLLRTSGSIEVVGTVSRVAQIVADSAKLKPDVLLLDLSWKNGAIAVDKIAGELRDRFLTTKIVLMTNYPEKMVDYQRYRLMVADVRLKGMKLNEWQTLLAGLMGVSDSVVGAVSPATKKGEHPGWIVLALVVSLASSTALVVIVGKDNAVAAIALGVAMFFAVSSVILILWRRLTGGELKDIIQMILKFLGIGGG